MPLSDSVTLTLPFSPHQFKLLLASSGFSLLVLLTWLAISAPSQKSRGNGWTSKGVLLGYSAGMLPIWCFLLFETLSALWFLTGKLPPSAGSTEIRWHVLAFVGLVTATGGLAGAPLALMRAWANERQTRTAEQNHMTDRISKAVEQLGAEKSVKRILGHDLDESGLDISLTQTTPKPVVEEVTEPNIEVRIGGLLALERISKDSIIYDNGRDHVRVMEILCAYIRNNAPESVAGELADGRFIRAKNHHAVSRKEDLPENKDTAVHSQVYALPRPRSDIALALRIIGRRSTDQIHREKQEGYRADLSRCNLQRAELAGGYFADINFFESRMEGAYLQNADFSYANLNGAVLTRASAKNTIFDKAKLENSDFSHALLNSVSFRKCVFSYTYFERTQIENVQFDIDMPRNAANRIWLEDPNLLSIRFSGNLGFTLSGSLRSPIKEVPPKHSAVIFRNATLSARNLNFFDPFRTFADGSVTLTSGARPAHWVDKILDDVAFEQAVQLWGNTYPEAD